MSAAVLAAAGVLTGTITIGPLTPVCRVGVPCAKPAAHVMVTFARPGHDVVASTDGAGRYRVSLAPGIWSVHSNAGMFIRPATIDVGPRPERLDLAIDTGIR